VIAGESVESLIILNKEHSNHIVSNYTTIMSNYNNKKGLFGLIRYVVLSAGDSGMITFHIISLQVMYCPFNTNSLWLKYILSV
jgi:hypothetical protein